MTRTLLIVGVMATLLVGCGSAPEKRAELARTEDELHTLTVENEILRTRLPGIVKMEEDNKQLQREVTRLSEEVDGLRRKMAARRPAASGKGFGDGGPTTSRQAQHG